MDAISNFLFTAGSFILVLTIVVFIHEFGHFWVARRCGVAVKAFSIGFGPEIIGFNDRHGTRWSFSWIPLGGYVKFIDDENSASAPAGADKLNSLTAEQRSMAFQTRPLAHRAAVVAAGPAFNILSAILLYFLIFAILGSWGTAAIVDGVVPNSAAAKAGIQAGDKITRIDGRSIERFADLQRVVSQSAGQPLNFTYERGGVAKSIEITPELRDILDPLCNKVKVGVIGIKRDPPAVLDKVAPGSKSAQFGLKSGDVVVAVNGQPIKFASELQKAVQDSPGRPLDLQVARGGQTQTVTVTPETREMKDAQCNVVQGGALDIQRVGGTEHWEHQSHGVFESVGLAFRETAFISMQILSGIPKLPFAIAKIYSGQKQSEIGGPIAIAEMTAHASRSGLNGFLGWICVFSIMLGIMNLLPIPVLDGGHLLFYAIEAVRGRPLDERKQELSFKIGLAILATMMIAAVFGDIMRKFGLG